MSIDSYRITLHSVALLTTMSVFILLTHCTKYLTKEFVTEDEIRARQKEGVETAQSLSTVHGWDMTIQLRSVYKSKNRDKNKENNYSAIIWPNQTADTLSEYNSSDRISVDSVVITLLPDHRTLILRHNPEAFEDSFDKHPIWRWAISFGEVHIPSEIDSVNVTYDVVIVGGDHQILDTGHFEYKLYRFEKTDTFPEWLFPP